MTRMSVAREGVPDRHNKTVIEIGALYVVKPRLPVTFQYNWSDLIGIARDFQRTEDGIISFDVELVDGLEVDLEKAQGYASIYGVRTTTRRDGNVHITNGIIGGVSIAPYRYMSLGTLSEI